MSNPWRAQVNQKLYFAQLLLDEAATRSGPTLLAQLQGAVFHLAGAYRLYLKEIAQYQRHDTDAPDARTACRQFAASDWACQELNELAQMEERGQWPARLLDALRDAKGVRTKTASKAADAPSIAMADVTDEVDVASVQQWLAQFQDLVTAQRESAQEF